jgi:Fe-S oxidoreductase
MCPSYMATRREHDTTRARANMLRHYFTQGTDAAVTANEVKDVLDLCLSCKACQTECPSSVDMTRMKAEFTQRVYDQRAIPLRARLVGNFSKLMQLASLVPWVYRVLYDTPAVRRLLNRLVGFHPERTMPTLNKFTVGSSQSTVASPQNVGQYKATVNCELRTVNLFLDEFTRYNDGHVAAAAVQLLARLGYAVNVPKQTESGRTYLSKGFVREARKRAIKNVTYLRDVVSAEAPLIGLEPSAILTFRDEYPDLVPADLKADARRIAQHTYLLEEWLAYEADAGRIRSAQFTTEARTVKVHGHCHQKALSGMAAPVRALRLPANYTVDVIPSGCCGMAGSFGYETEHYALSMQIGELVLFPAVRAADAATIIAAPGTSCRHQIKDGTGRVAKHPAEVLLEALR